jgi:hypothetical protein
VYSVVVVRLVQRVQVVLSVRLVLAAHLVQRALQDLGVPLARAVSAEQVAHLATHGDLNLH